MVLVPLVALNAVPDTVPATSGAERLAASADLRAARQTVAESAATRADRGTETPAPPVSEVPPTTVPPTTVPPSTTAAPPPTTAAVRAPRAAVATTTSARPKPTTTTAAPTTTTTAKPPAPANRQEGGASFYDAPRADTCAHRTLRFGTVLRVTNLSTGKQTTCTVNDRGPFIEGRIVDLSRETFSRIAPTSAGVIKVSIEW